MAEPASSIDAIFDALPAVQEAVRVDIAARMAAGEFIAGVEGDRIIASHPVNFDLAARRKELMAQYEADRQASTRSKTAA